MRHQAYICYANQDESAAAALVERLEARNVPCWFPARDQDKNLSPSRFNSAAMDSSHVMIVLWSEKTPRPLTIREVDWARSTGLPIVPIRLTDFPLQWPALQNSPGIQNTIQAGPSLRNLDINTVIAAVEQPRPVVKIRLFLYVAEGLEVELEGVRSLVAATEERFGGRVSITCLFWDSDRPSAPQYQDETILVISEVECLELYRLLTFLNDDSRVVPTEGTFSCSFEYGSRISGLFAVTKKLPVPGGQDFQTSLKVVTERRRRFEEMVEHWIKSGQEFPTAYLSNRDQLDDYVERKIHQALQKQWRPASPSNAETPSFRRRQGSIHFPKRSVTLLSARFADAKPRNRDLTEGVGQRRATDTWSPPPPPPRTRRSVLNKASFFAFAPVSVKAESQFILEIWACTENQYSETRRRITGDGKVLETGRKGPVSIELGTLLNVSVSIPAFGLEGAKDTMLWDEEPVNATFAVNVPNEVVAGEYVGTAQISVGVVPLALLHFVVAVGATPERVQELNSKENRIRSIFASYSSVDRVDVLEFSRGAEAVGVEVFVDALSLREGDNWEARLFQEVPSRDLFCLFWSKAASESPWVEKEWRCALGTRGIDYIHPVPLADPREVRPPQELVGKHFESPTRWAIEYEKHRKAPPAEF